MTDLYQRSLSADRIGNFILREIDAKNIQFNFVMQYKLMLCTLSGVRPDLIKYLKK